MPISNTKKISNGTISCTRINIIFHYSRRIELDKFAQVLFKIGFLKCSRLRNKLNKPIASGTSQCFIWSKPVVLIDSLEQSVHQKEHLQNHLILTKIISTFEQESKFLLFLSQESELTRYHS